VQPETDTQRTETLKTMPQSAENSAPNVSGQLRKWRALDSREDVQRRVMRALRTVETIMYAEHTPDEERRKCATTVSQLARTYLKCLEVGEYEERITALEKAQERRQSNGTVFNRN
jgi:uncharacterized small protein (DUF1192 family)